MAFTFIQFQDQVARFVRTENKDNVLIQVIKDLINVALYEVARTNRWPELLKHRTSFPLTGVDVGGKVVLPNNAMVVDRVAYSVPTVPVKEWTIPERSKLIPPAKVSGKPRCYNVVQGTAPAPIALFLDPFAGVDTVSDSLFVDFYVTPPLLAVDADTPLSNMWDVEILRKAEQLYLIYNNKLPMAQAVTSVMELARLQPQSQSAQS